MLIYGFAVGKLPRPQNSKQKKGCIFMKKLLILIFALSIFSSSAVFAKSDYDEYYNEVKEYADIDWDTVDEDKAFFADDSSYLELKKPTAVKKLFYWIIPAKDSDDFYAAGFQRNKYVMTIKNFKGVEPFKYFSYDEAKAYAKENGLDNITDISAILLRERVYMYGYRIESNGQSYIIPYLYSEDSLFNRTGDPECEMTVGKAYTVAEVIEKCEREEELDFEYRKEKAKEENEKNPAISVDDQGNDVITGVDPENGDKEENENNDKEKTEKDDVKKSEEKENNNEEKITENKENNEKETDSKENSEKDADASEASKESDKGVAKSKSFTDVPQTHWAYNAITKLADKNTILGYGNGYFGVNDSVTYEQISLLLKREFNYDESLNDKLPAKREDVIVSLVKAMNVDLSDISTQIIDDKFDDGKEISNANKAYIAYAVKSGLVVGYERKLNPNSAITRAETACLLYRATDLIK